MAEIGLLTSAFGGKKQQKRSTVEFLELNPPNPAYTPPGAQPSLGCLYPPGMVPAIFSI